MQMTDDPYTLERWQDDIATIATALRPGERLQIAIGRQPPIITNADGYVCTVDERLRQLQATPTCPCCHGKFTKPRGTTTCNRCGLPDDVITAGPNAIARYTKTYHRTTAAAARVRSSTPRRSKHGRQRPTRRRT